MSTASRWSPPPSLVDSGRVTETENGTGWAFVPRALPPLFDLADVNRFLIETVQALRHYSLEMTGCGPERACEWFFSCDDDDINRSEVVRQGREPWRNRSKEHELYIQAVRRDRAPLATLINSVGLAAIHRELVDDGEPMTQRFFHPGQLRRGPGVLTRNNGEIEVVHPPCEQIERLLAEIASYLEATRRDHIHPLLVAAALHYQIVAIHPFADGNGRVARFLAELCLLQAGVVSPALPLTLIFRRHYAGYLARLAGVTLKEDWNKWIRFFCAAIAQEVAEAIKRTHSASAPVAMG